MSSKGHPAFRLPINAVLLGGFGGLVAVAVAIVLFLGFVTARENTVDLLSDKAEAAVEFMVSHIDRQLRPISDQARWITKEISAGKIDIDDHTKLDAFMLGALAATPQTAGIAIVRRDGRMRRYMRQDQAVIASTLPIDSAFQTWFGEVERSTKPAWRQPNWDTPLHEPIIVHETPLRTGGELVGALVQVIPVSVFSRHLVTRVEATGHDTPFVLFDKSRVLVHPILASLMPQSRPQQDLPTVDELGDIVLQGLWDEETSRDSFLKLERAKARVVRFEHEFFIVLYREMETYGQKPWTVGLYFNTEYSDTEIRRMRTSFIAGAVILLVAVFIAIKAGKLFARPIRRISEAAATVQSGNLGDVEDLPGSRIGEMDDASRSFNEMVQGLRDRDMIRETLGRYVPERVAETLLRGGGELEPEETVATVLFSDIEGFTAMTQDLGPQGTVEVLNAYFSAMVEILEAHGGVVTQFQGDGILATFNVPIVADDHAEQALDAAQKMLEACREQTFAGRRLGCRVGINTGSVIAGAVGANDRLTYTVHGDAVNLAARLEGLNKDLGTRILVSGSTAALVRSHELISRSKQAVRGVAGEVEIFELVVPGEA